MHIYLHTYIHKFHMHIHRANLRNLTNKILQSHQPENNAQKSTYYIHI